MGRRKRKEENFWESIKNLLNIDLFDEEDKKEEEKKEEIEKIDEKEELKTLKKPNDVEIRIHITPLEYLLFRKCEEIARQYGYYRNNGTLRMLMKFFIKHNKSLFEQDEKLKKIISRI